MTSFTKRLLLGLSVVLLSSHSLTAAPPTWWASYGVTIPGHAADDYALVNQGQLKQMATRAVWQLGYIQPGGQGVDLLATYSSLFQTNSATDDYAPVTVGQLKALAKPFYDRLAEAGYSGPPLSGSRYPWPNVPSSPNDFAYANIGQVKYVFSFDLGVDSDGGGAPDWWETAYGFNPNDPSDEQDNADGDDLLNVEEYNYGANPLMADTDLDSFSDGLEVWEWGSDPADYYNGSAPNFYVAGNYLLEGPPGDVAGPFTMHVYDSDQNPLANAPVRFNVVAGGGKFRLSPSGSDIVSSSFEMLTDANGDATIYYVRSTEAGAVNRITARIGTAHVNLGETTFSGVSTGTAVNDFWSAAKPIFGKLGKLAWSNWGATSEPGEPSHDGQSGPYSSVWFKWFAPANGRYFFKPTSFIYPVCAIYTGPDISSLQQLAFGVDGNATPFDAVTNQAYYIAMDSRFGSIGIFDLEWGLSPLNDDFANPAIFNQPLIPGSNMGASPEPGEPNHIGNPPRSSVWYLWTAPTTARYSFELTYATYNLSFYPIWEIYTGSSLNSLVSVASGQGYPNRTAFQAVQGQQYRIAVDDYYGNGSTFGLNMRPTPPNDQFAAAQVIPFGQTTVNTSNWYATREEGEPYHAGVAGGASVWYVWTAPNNGTLTVDTRGSNLNTVLAVYTGTSVDQLNLVAENNDEPGYYTSKVTFPVISGQQYHIAVDGLTSGSYANITLHLNFAVP